MKLTKAQMEILKKMADGCTLHWLAGIRSGPSCRLRGADKSYGERVRADYSHKFYKLGLIQMYSDPAWAWRDRDYRISEKGLEFVSGKDSSQ